MTFNEALHEVITNDRVVWRKTLQFADNYDRPYPDKSPPTPWSEWLRIRLEDDDDADFDAILFFEGNNLDDTSNTWFLEWTEQELTKADVLADDWEVVEN
jgi:hypothetical protein